MNRQYKLKYQLENWPPGTVVELGEVFFRPTPPWDNGKRQLWRVEGGTRTKGWAIDNHRIADWLEEIAEENEMKVVLRQPFQGKTLRKTLEKVIEWDTDAMPFPPQRGMELVEGTQGDRRSVFVQNTYYDLGRNTTVVSVEGCRTSSDELAEQYIADAKDFGWSE